MTCALHLASVVYTTHVDDKLVINADADVRLARRIKRDTVEKGRDIATVLDQVRWNLLQYLSFPAYIGLLFIVCF